MGALLLSPAHAAEVEGFVMAQHTSDLFRGWPFNDRDEYQEEYIAFGATVRVGRHKAFEIDLSHGLKRLDCQDWEGGSQITVRWYPGRRFRRKN